MKQLDDKQPFEEYHITLNFIADLGTDTISNCTVTVTDSGGSDVTSSLTDDTKNTATGQELYLWLQGGTDKKVYKYTVQVETSAAEKYEYDAQLKVIDQ